MKKKANVERKSKLLKIFVIMFSMVFIGNFITILENTTVNAAGVDSTISDEFNENILSPDWTWIDPLGDCTYNLTANPGYLRINANTGEHDLWSYTNYNSPRILQPIDEEVTNIETRVVCNPISVTQGAVLLVWGDLNNVLKLERLHGITSRRDSYPGTETDFIRFDGRSGGGEWQYFAEVRTSQTDVYLKLSRTNDIYTAFYSSNGLDWTLLSSTTFSYSGSLNIGLCLINQATNSPFYADFDYFRVTENIINNYPPSVNIISPDQGDTLSGLVTISGTASDQNGASDLQYVQVKIDTSDWITASGTSSWSYSWDTTSLQRGSHTISARSYDGKEYSILATINVIVQNDETIGNLVGYWKFDEGSGTIAADSSGNGNTGTLINNPTWVDGKSGKALSFNGVNNYVKIPDSNSLDMTSQITVEAWVYPRAYVDNVGNACHIVSRSDFSGGPVYVLGLPGEGTKFNYDISFVGTYHRSNADVKLNNWAHIAVTYDGFYVKFYINGEFDSSYAYTGSIPITNNWLAIGCKPTGSHGGAGTYAYFNGIIDEVRIYNRALSQQEIQLDMENISPPITTSDGLVGYWNFDEGTGNIATDSSGSGNTGALVNNPVWVDGKSGKALNFNGVDNNVVVPDSNSLHLSSAVTVMTWVYLPEGAHYGDSRILSKDASNGGSNLALEIHDDSGHVALELGYGGGFTGPVAISTGYVPRNVWTHIATTYDGSVIKIYINGILDSTTSWATGFDTDNGMPLCIGSKNYLGSLGGASYEFWINATLDDVKIYNRALSQQEIQAEVGNISTSSSHNGTPGFETVATITAIATAGALVAFFRRRDRNR